jgi:hypothetical protein
MNRSILIVICDFLLVSLLAFSTVDINKVADEGTPRTVKIDLATNQVDSGKDLAAVMRLALDEEKRSRDQLLGELSRTREEASRQQTVLGEREKQMQTFQQELLTRDQQAQRLQQELQTREQQAQQFQQRQTALEQQYTLAQTNIQTLSQQLQSSSSEALLAKEKIAAMQAEMASLQKSNQLAAAEKQTLANQLQVAEVERRNAAEKATAMQEQVKIEREEKARLTQQATQLAEGVKVLANKSGELAQEVRENRPLAPNAIFSEYATNRVTARFSAVRPGLLGDANKRRDTDTLLVTNGTNTFALCHIQDTPLTLFNPGTEWDALTGTLNHNAASQPIRSLCFYLRDPRLVFIPLTQAEVRQLNSKVYRISTEPYKFQDAVLIGAREGYYGECRFQLDLSTPDYVKLDNNFIKGLFGKFNPSRGDLVLSKTGELLGVMANSSYCLMIRDFSPAASFTLSTDLRGQHTALILSQLYSIVVGLGPKLQ